MFYHGDQSILKNQILSHTNVNHLCAVKKCKNTQSWNHWIQKSKLSYANAHWAKGLAIELFCCYASRKHITMHQVRKSCLCKFWNCTLAMTWSARLPNTKLCYQSRKPKSHQCKVFELSCPKTMKITKVESMHTSSTPEILTRPESQRPQNCIHHELDTPQCQRLPKSIWR